MTKIHIAFLLFFAGVANLMSGQGASLSPDSLLMIQFQRNTKSWQEAYNSKDASNLIPLYAESAQYISGHVAGLVANGRDALIGNFQNGMDMGGHIDSVEILKAEVSCDLATLLCKYEATNNGIKAIGRNLLVLKKVDGNWLIVMHMTVV